MSKKFAVLSILKEVQYLMFLNYWSEEDMIVKNLKLTKSNFELNKLVDKEENIDNKS